MKLLTMFATLLTMTATAHAGEMAKGERPTTPAFEKLKSLAGDWTMAGGEGGVASSWKVTANGSAVVETLFPGAPHEMVTVYTLHGKEIHLTHYCAAGNQPEMKADKRADAKKIAFQFVGGAGINPKKDMHMHSATLAFTDADTLHEEWGTFADGKPGDAKVFELKRIVAPAAK